MNRLKNLTPPFLFLLFAACATTNTMSTDSINTDFNIIAQGQFSNISLARELVITNKADWQRLWNIHRGSQQRKIPRINFDNKIVIVIFAGQQPSGGYAVGVSHLKRLDDNLVVVVTFKEPRNGQSVSLALTQPYIFISTEKVDGKVSFVANTATNLTY